MTVVDPLTADQAAHAFDVPAHVLASTSDVELRIVVVSRFDFADYRLAKVIEPGTLYTQPHEMENRLEGREEIAVTGVRLETDAEVIETYRHKPTLIAAGDTLIYRFTAAADELLGPAGEYEVRDRRWWRR